MAVDQPNVPAESPTEPLEINGNGEYALDIVGESHYQDALSEICGGKTRDSHDLDRLATLVFENNPNDQNAVRVDIEGKTVGYLQRPHAQQLRRQITGSGFPNTILSCSAKIVGGWDRGKGKEGYFGVKLDIPFTP